MMVYFGLRLVTGKTVVLKKDISPKEENAQVVNMNISQALPHHVLHSPDGFEWGYGGSGPADLAYNILLDFLNGDQEKAKRLYQIFKQDFILPIKGNSWLIVGSQIQEWLRTKCHEITTH